MTKRKILTIVIAVIIIVASFAAYQFYRANLRGGLPAILPPDGDITQLLPPSSNTSAQGTNTTNMPLKLPEGFSIGIFAKDLGAPRVIVFDQSSQLLVSIPSSGQVVAIPDDNLDGVGDKSIIVAENLNKPHGLAFNCGGSAGVQKCKLYIAEMDKVRAWDYDQGTAKASNPQKIVDLPSGGNHPSRTIQILEIDGQKKLLVSIGSSCNVCREEDNRRAAIWYSNLDGSDFKTFATGLRNTVFFTPHPVTNQIWGTEMGRDLIGDDIPPDEVNIIYPPTYGEPYPVNDYGWPYCYGKNIQDETFSSPKYNFRCGSNGVFGSHIDIPAHSAPLGLTFISDDGPGGWPMEWKNDLLVALHGSWNRSTPAGYKIVRYDLDDDDKVLGVSDFLTGFLQSKNAKQALGRPVDILVTPGGYMYVSDDKAGVIYRITAPKPSP